MLLNNLLSGLALGIEGFGLGDGGHDVVILDVLGVVPRYPLLLELAKSLSWWYLVSMGGGLMRRF